MYRGGRPWSHLLTDCAVRVRRGGAMGWWACPHISRVAALSNPDNPVSRPIIPAMQEAAAPLSLMVEVFRAQSPNEFTLAFDDMAKSRVDSVVVTEDGEFASSFRAIAMLALAEN